MGCAHLYADHPDYAGEVDHPALVRRLLSDFDVNGALPVEAPTVWGFETCNDACKAAEAYLDDARFDHDAARKDN